MRRTRKKPIWEYRIYFSVIFIFSLPGALLTCMKSLVKGKIEKDLNNYYENALALLQELIKFNHKGNFDRAMALMVGMYHTREMYNSEVQEILEDNSSAEWFDSNYY